MVLGPAPSRGGRGKADGALAFFSRRNSPRNPADWLMDVLSGVVPNERIADFKPAMLFELWGKKSDSIRRDQAGEQTKNRGAVFAKGC